MDNDGPTSRMEKGFWTVWGYITGAVSRFLRPDPSKVVSNEPKSFQDSTADSQPADCGHAEGDTSDREVSEEQPLAKASLLSSSRPVVAWELCTAEIDLGPDEQSVQNKTQPSKASEEGEGTREEQFANGGNDDAGWLIGGEAKQNEQEENKVGKSDTHGQDEMQENDEYEESLRLTGDAMSEDVEKSGRKAGFEDETERAVTPDDHQKMEETITKIHVKEEEEDNKMQQEDEQDLEEEDIEVKLHTIMDFSLEEDDNMHIEETPEKAEDSDGVLQLVSENENKSDEGARQVENQLSVCDELSDDNRDFKGDPGFTSLHAELQMSYEKGGIVSEDELIVVAQSDKVEDLKEKEEESTLDEREQGAVIEEENVNETIDDILKQEDNVRSVTEDNQEEDISTGHLTHSEEVVQNAKTDLHTAEFTDREKDVAKDTKVKTKTTYDAVTESHGGVIDGKPDMTTTDIPVDERFFKKDQVEEEWLSSEEGDNESYVEAACTTSVTVKPEGENGQEISGEFKNISPGICEGRLVVSQELNSPTCEETHEGVPEYNNEPGPDENTTQRFLEVGNCEEIQNTQLPEEVESTEPETLQNSGCSTGAEHLLVREHKEEDQESTKDIKNSFDLVVEEHTGILRHTDTVLPQEREETALVEPVIQESALIFEQEEGKLLVDSMKTGIEWSEREFEPETGKTTTELQDGTEELLVEFEIDEGLCYSKEAVAAGDDREITGAVAAGDIVTDETLKFLEAEVQKMSEMSFLLLQESVDDRDLEQNSFTTPSLLEDFTESGFLKQSVESEAELLEDSTVDMQDAGIGMEDTADGDEEEEEAAEENLQVVGMAAELELNKKETSLIAQSESLEIKNQLSDETLDISDEEMSTDTEASDELMTTESKPKDLTEEMARHVPESEGSYAEETIGSISEHQDVIEEEILDLWIQAALSEDSDGIRQQEGPEPGQQMDKETEPSSEEQDEISLVQTEKAKEQLMESNSGESVSDTEMSPSTAESGFLDQSLGEQGTQNSEPLMSANTDSFQGIYDMLANMSESADISGLSTQQPNFESQDILMEETAETGQLYLKEEKSVTETGFHPDLETESSEAGPLNQESQDDSQEKTDEGTGSQKEIDAEVTELARETDWEDTEDADVKSLTENSALLKVKETKVEDEPFEITASDSPDEIKHTDSGRSRSGSEASSEEEIVSTESGSQGDTCTDTEKKLSKVPSLDKRQPRWSEDNADSLPGLKKAEVAEQPMTASEDQMEVDASTLDFTAQKSRIAVKNPHVRPPKDPRSLLHMPSVEPTPPLRLPVKVIAGVPLGGLGIGIKLPGLGAGLPVLKKTQRVVKDENTPDTLSKEPETKPEEKSDTPKQNEAQHKPKWMPPRHPGFGNPLMSELKTKLKKTTKE